MAFRANPQGSREPAIANRFSITRRGHYETDEHFNQRIAADVRKVTDKITQVTGKAPRAWVWPYGAANGTSLAIAQKQGYQLAFTPGRRAGKRARPRQHPAPADRWKSVDKTFSNTVSRVQEFDPVRVMHVDLDYVYDPDPAQQTKNINKLVQRVYDMKISHVFLQAFSDPRGDGRIDALYFPNRRPRSGRSL